MVEADVFLTPATDSTAPRYARKRIHCLVSTEYESAGNSPRKNQTVEGVHGVSTKYECRECRFQDTDNVAVSVIRHLSSKQGSGSALENPTGGCSTAPRFVSMGVDACDQEDISEKKTNSKDTGDENSDIPEGEKGGIGNYEGKKRPRVLKSAHQTSHVSTVKSLLSTGILEGLPVKYTFNKHKVEIPGLIRDLGYLCGCSSCNYTRVLSALEFEKHSGITSKNQTNHIFLSNGKSLYRVVKELAKYQLSSLESVIESIIGCTPNWGCYKAWKESFQEGNHGSQDRNLIGDAKKRSDHETLTISQIGSSYPKCTQATCISSELNSEIQNTPVMFEDPSKTDSYGLTTVSGINSPFSFVTQEASREKRHYPNTSHKSDSFPIQGRNISTCLEDGRKCASKMLKSAESPDLHTIPDALFCANVKPNSSAQRSSKKRFKRGTDLHRLIFLENGLPDGAELAYCVRGQTVLKGHKMGNGIACHCCKKEISPSQFEAHAGWASRRQPYHNIFTSNSVSLHDLSIYLSKGRHLTVISSDNDCSVCGDGGELILCTRCPKAFHKVCLGLDYTPHGEWHCSYCNDEIISGAASRDAKMAVRVARVIETPTIESGCCYICRGNHFSCLDTFNDETVLICDQCEKEFHVGCLRKSGMCDLRVLPEDNWFCHSDCMTIYASLQSIIFNEAKIVPETLSKQLGKLQPNGLMTNAGFDVRWQLLSGKIRSSENRFLLSKAFEIFRNCFDPIIERSGRDLIPAIVHGRDMGGHELGGMYCAILTVKSVVVSAGILRVLGKEAAELPLAATRQENQGRGFFRCLLSCIELLLHELNVETLILPATENAELMWVHKFGFREMPAERCQSFAKIYPIMMFRGTKMLEKPVSTII